MKLDIWSIFIIVIIFQGLFLLFVLLFSKNKKDKKKNQYLLYVILVLIWFLVEFFTVRNKIDVGLNIFYGTRYGSWFLLGPLTYFYFKSITESTWKFSKKEILHFLPFILFVIIIPFIAYKALNDRQIDYGMLSVFDHREKVISTIQYVYSVIFILQFVHLGYFLYRNLKLVNIYSKELVSEYSTLDPRIKWLRYFNMTLLFILLFSAIFLYVLLITDIYRRHLDYIYVLPIGFLFYFITFYFIRTEWKPTDKNFNKYVGSSLNPKLIPEYITTLNQLMDTEKMYLNHNLRLSDLAEKMTLSKHHLSQLINQQYNLSFYDFINKHRTAEAKKIINDHRELKLIQVAFDAGFNNKTSFVNAFKKFEKTTPSKFREAILIS